MGVEIRRDVVDRTLADAFRIASEIDGSLLVVEANREILSRIRALQHEASPKTYLAVAATLLTARAMHGDRVDVTVLRSSAGPKGFSAGTVAVVLAGFAKTHGIDLRAASSAPFNNQPFTFKSRLSDVEPAARHWLAYEVLVSTADLINRMTNHQAMRALAGTFVLCRRLERPVALVDVSGGRRAFRGVCADVSRFATANSDGGRVGQALCAALLDLVHQDVVLGAVNDPDARLAGDVHCGDPASPWLWCEVKQKVIVTGDVISFMTKVSDAGGQRCLYLALRNRHHPGRVDLQAAHVQAESLGVDLTVVSSPGEAIRLLTTFAPGDLAEIASRLLERMRARLVESDCAREVITEFDALIKRHGRIALG